MVDESSLRGGRGFQNGVIAKGVGISELPIILNRCGALFPGKEEIIRLHQRRLPDLSAGLFGEPQGAIGSRRDAPRTTVGGGHWILADDAGGGDSADAVAITIIGEP